MEEREAVAANMKGAPRKWDNWAPNVKLVKITSSESDKAFEQTICIVSHQSEKDTVTKEQLLHLLRPSPPLEVLLHPPPLDVRALSKGSMIEIRGQRSKPDLWQPVVVVSASKKAGVSSFGSDWRQHIAMRRSLVKDQEEKNVSSSSMTSESSLEELKRISFPPCEYLTGHIPPLSSTIIHAGKILDRYRSCWISDQDLSEGHVRRMTIWTPLPTTSSSGDHAKHLLSGRWSIYDRDQVLSDKVGKALMNLKREKLVKKVLSAKGGQEEREIKDGPATLGINSSAYGVLIKALARCPTKLSVAK